MVLVHLREDIKGTETIYLAAHITYQKTRHISKSHTPMYSMHTLIITMALSLGDCCSRQQLCNHCNQIVTMIVTS